MTDDPIYQLIIRRHLREWYESYARPARRVLAEQLLTLENFREDIGMKGFHSVEGRVKSIESVEKALIAKRYEGLFGFPDLVGIRVVVHSLDDIDVVAECFLRQVESKDLNLIETKQKDDDGYQARHLLFEVPGSYRRNSGFTIKMEVQLRTLCQHVFGTLSRTYLYRNPNVTPERHREALTAQLRPAEEWVSNLQREAHDGHAFDPANQMSPDSFRKIVREVFKEEVSVSAAVATVLFQRDRGIDTNGDLRKAFTDGERKREVEEILQLDGTLPEERRVFREIPIYRVHLMVADGGFEFIKTYLQRLASANPPS